MKTILFSIMTAFAVTAQSQDLYKKAMDSQSPVNGATYGKGGVETRGAEPVNLHANNKGMGPLYFNDVIIENSTLDQRNVKISAAFNGWLYAAYSTSNTSTGAGGITIRRSKDDGITWSTIDAYSVPNVRYNLFDIVVAGTDTNNLTLYNVGVNNNISSNNYLIFFDKYNATTGTWAGNYGTAINYGTRRVNDVAIASDYKFPALGASPYSIGILYSVFGSPNDSIIFLGSSNGGSSLNIRQPVTATTQYSRKVDISYGKSQNGSNGRYFGVWEQLNSFIDRNGNIFTSRSASTVGGTWIKPKNLDSLSSSMIGLCRNPVIAVQQNTINNDSTGTTAVVVVERDYTGTGSDYDVLGFYNKVAHYSNFWNRFDVMNTSEVDNQPHIAYDPANNNFLLVFHDSTNHELPYCVNGMNMSSPSTWGYITTKYNDLTTNIINPWPRVDINPSVVKTVHVWNSEGAGKGVSLFDAENLYTVVKEATEVEVSGEIYPNPARDNINLIFELKNTQNVSMELYDAIGNVVLKENYNGLDSGKNFRTISINHLPEGVYVLKLTSDKVMYSKKVIKTGN